MQLYAIIGNEIYKWVKERVQKIRIKIKIEKINKNKFFKFQTIWPGDLLAFSRTGPSNSRTSPGNATMNIAVSQGYIMIAML